MMSEHVFDVVAVGEDGAGVKIGRTWLSEKEGQFRFRFDLSSMPICDGGVHLVAEGPSELGDCPTEFALKMPITKEGKPTYWHPVGKVSAAAGDGEQAFDVVFTSMPLSGNLLAFPLGA